MSAAVGLWLWAPDGVGEVTQGADLARILVEALPDLADGDVVMVTSKVVSKAEGRVVAGRRDDALAGETVRLVARRGATRIVENHLGLVMAAAGIDASNVAPGWLVLLPVDPDASARKIREEVFTRTGRNVAVLVTDTAGRPWRHGQSDLAIGAAGLEVLDDHAGRIDGYGNPLAVTAPAVADEIAGASDLVRGKLAGRPFAVLRGLISTVLPPGDHGPGARSLTRSLAEDMFALGTREAVLAALTGTAAESFGAPASASALVAALASIGVPAVEDGDDVRMTEVAASDRVRVEVLAHAFGWLGKDADDVLTRRPS